MQFKMKYTFLFFLPAMVLFCGCNKKSITTTTSVQTKTEAVAIDSAKLENEYENNVKQIMAPYWLASDSSGIKDKILALKAPSKYLDFHLNLVIGLELIDQGKNTGDQAKIQSGQEKINQLASKYLFIK